MRPRWLARTDAAGAVVSDTEFSWLAGMPGEMPGVIEALPFTPGTMTRVFLSEK